MKVKKHEREARLAFPTDSDILIYKQQITAGANLFRF